MTSAEVCSTKKNKRDRRQQSRLNAIESNGNIFGVPKDSFSIETSIASLAVPQQHPSQRSVDPVMSQSQVENIEKEKNVLASASDGSPAMTSAEISLRKKDKRKRRQEIRHNAIESNISGVSKDTFSSETFKDALATPLQHPAQHSVDPAMRQSQVENAAKEKNVFVNALDGSPAMTSAVESLRKKNKRKSRWESRHNAIESNGNLPGVSKDTFSTETPLAAVAVPLQNPTHPAMRQPQVEKSTKEKNMLENASDGSPALTSTDVILIKKDKRKRRQENRHNTIESNDNLSVVPIVTFSTETSSAALSLPLQYSAEHSLGPVAGQSQVKNAVKEEKVLENVMNPVMSSAELSLTKKNRRKRRQKQRLNAIERNGDLSGVPKDTFSTETFGTAALAMPSQHPDQYSLDPVTRQSLVENVKMEKSVLGNATGKSPAMTSVEVSLRKKNEGRRGEKRHNAIETNVNVSDVPKDNFSSQTSPSTLDMPTQHPGEYSMDPVMRQSQKIVMRQPTQHLAFGMLSQQPAQFLSMHQVMRQSRNENKGKEHNMLGMGLESSYGEHKLETENSSPSSEVAYAVNFLRGFISEVTRLNTVQGEIADLSLVSGQDDCSTVSHFPLGRNITSHSKKKLLVLDLNGVLADFVPSVPEGYTPHGKISGKAVFKRPFCDDFLQFCFDRFHVGIWSSRKGKNVYAAIRFLVGKSASKLLFSWNLYHCTRTKFKTIKNEHKPLVLKELRKLWEKHKPDLPWEKGEFNESNTLLLDDSPYKALRNPMHNAIFPYSYHYSDANDTLIGPGGNLWVYLEGLAMAENVQEYVASHPFGQPAITESDPNWDLYRGVIDRYTET